EIRQLRCRIWSSIVPANRPRTLQRQIPRRPSCRRAHAGFPFPSLRTKVICGSWRAIHMKPAVGLIGLGLMGRPMGQNLLKAGFALAVWNRTEQRGDELVRLGGARGESA